MAPPLSRRRYRRSAVYKQTQGVIENAKSEIDARSSGHRGRCSGAGNEPGGDRLRDRGRDHDRQHDLDVGHRAGADRAPHPHGRLWLQCQAGAGRYGADGNQHADQEQAPYRAGALDQHGVLDLGEDQEEGQRLQGERRVQRGRQGRLVDSGLCRQGQPRPQVDRRSPEPEIHEALRRGAERRQGPALCLPAGLGVRDHQRQPVQGAGPRQGELPALLAGFGRQPEGVDRAQRDAQEGDPGLLLGSDGSDRPLQAGTPEHAGLRRQEVPVPDRQELHRSAGFGLEGR